MCRRLEPQASPASGTIWPWPHQFSSVAQSFPSLCDPMNHSTPGLPVHHQLPEFTQTHVHPVAWAAPNADCPARPTQPTEPWEIIYVKVSTFWGGCCYCCFSKLLKWDIKPTYNRLHKPWVYSIVKFHKWVHLYNYDPDQDIGHSHNPKPPLCFSTSKLKIPSDCSCHLNFVQSVLWLIFQEEIHTFMRSIHDFTNNICFSARFDSIPKGSYLFTVLLMVIWVFSSLRSPWIELPWQ